MLILRAEFRTPVIPSGGRSHASTRNYTELETRCFCPSLLVCLFRLACIPLSQLLCLRELPRLFHSGLGSELGSIQGILDLDAYCTGWFSKVEPLTVALVAALALNWSRLRLVLDQATVSSLTCRRQGNSFIKSRDSQLLTTT